MCLPTCVCGRAPQKTCLCSGSSYIHSKADINSESVESRLIGFTVKTSAKEAKSPVTQDGTVMDG